MWFDNIENLPTIAAHTGFSIFELPKNIDFSQILPNAYHVRKTKKNEQGSGAAFISIDQIRDIFPIIDAKQSRAFYIVIEEAELMNLNAQNAALKLLEEPPPSVIFLLCVCNPDLLLETVRSRCAMISLSGDAAQQDADAAKLADSFLTAVRTGERHRLYRWIAKNELSKLDATSAFIDAALSRSCDMVCGRSSAGVLTTEQQMHLYRLLQRCSDHLKVNVNAKHIFSLLAADALPGPSGTIPADTVHKIGEKT